MTRKIELTDDEIRHLVSLLKGEAAFYASKFETRKQVNAECLVRKLEQR